MIHDILQPSVKKIRLTARANRLTKLLIGLAMALSVYFHLSWRNVLDTGDWLFINKLYYLLGATLLVPLNWFLESAKWRLYMQRYTKINYLISFKTILTGTCVGIFTPARLGEYGGRLLHIEPGLHYRAIQATFIGSLAQNITGIVFGLFGLTMYLQRIQVHQLNDTTALYLVTSGLCILLIAFYFQLHRLKKLTGLLRLNHVVFIKRLLQFPKLPFSILMSLLSYSFVRYGVYTLQYILVLMYFGIAVDFELIAYAVMLIFFIQGSVPLPAFLGIMARAEIAVLVLGQLNFSQHSIVVASYVLWFLNIFIPALAGYLLIIKLNLWKNLGLQQ